MRYKWLNVEWPAHIDQLALRMKSLDFSSNQHHGFVIDKIRDELIEARYIEKISFTDTVTDPFGNETKFDRIEYRESAFRITNAFPTLELINAPRSLQALLNRLSEITDFEVSIEQLRVDVLSWAEELIKAINGTGSFDSMQISKLELGKKTFAKILVTGEQDIKQLSAELISGRRHVVEKIRIRLHHPLKGSIILTNTGSATVNMDDLEENTVRVIRASLAIAL
ncbi:hypothetical protein [Pseudomonas sp. 1928-m]|uniref:hypothetical protein n=1 Tax=Pseudomonas sp. 1928-m TaxID=3033804 RepID=UPI0023DE78E1|nr:hypothetical protein [Pseudomonas sp. 1928-m]MDF3195682.1 hypothetical protein [Pseudomonas sp. 1928-m]